MHVHVYICNVNDEKVKNYHLLNNRRRMRDIKLKKKDVDDIIHYTLQQ